VLIGCQFMLAPYHLMKPGARYPWNGEKAAPGQANTIA
jgi:hypothetical protein